MQTQLKKNSIEILWMERDRDQNEKDAVKDKN